MTSDRAPVSARAHAYVPQYADEGKLRADVRELSGGVRPWLRVSQDVYEADRVRAFWVNPSEPNGPPFSFDRDPSHGYFQVGPQGINVGHITRDSTQNRTHDTDALISSHATKVSHVWNAGSQPGVGMRRAVDVALSDGWATAGYCQVSPQHTSGVRMGGWAGDNSYAFLSAYRDSCTGWVTFGANRKASAERLPDHVAATMAKKLGMAEDEPLYRLNIRSKVNKGFTPKICVTGAIVRLDLAKGSEWEWSTLASRETVHDVIYGKKGLVKHLDGKAKALGFAQEDVDIDLSKPESMRLGDRVTVVQKGQFSVTAAGGTHGVYAGVIATAIGTAKTTVVKTAENELLLYREPLDVKSFSRFAGSPIGLQLRLSKAHASDYREAFRFRFNPKDRNDPVRKSFDDALRGKMPCALHKLEIRYGNGNSNGNAESDVTEPLDATAAHMDLVARENRELPKGIDRLFVGQVDARSFSRSGGLYFFLVPRGWLPEKIENSLARQSTDYGFVEAVVRGDGKLATAARAMGHRDDWDVLHRGHRTHNEYCTAQWMTRRDHHHGDARDFQLDAVVCHDAYDETRVRTQSYKGIIDALNSTHGLDLPAPSNDGHRESRRVEVVRTFTEDDLLRIARHGRRQRHDIQRWSEETGIDASSISKHLDAVGEAELQIRRSAGMRPFVGEIQRFYAQHGSAAMRLWHVIAGGNDSDYHVNTQSDAYVKPEMQADNLSLKYPRPVQPDDENAEERYADVVEALTYIRDVSIPVLTEDPFMPPAEKQLMLLRLGEARRQILKIAGADHLSNAARFELVQRLAGHLLTSKSSLYACDYLDYEPTPVRAARAMMARRQHSRARNPNADDGSRDWHVRRIEERLERCASNPLLTNAERCERIAKLVDTRVAVNREHGCNPKTGKLLRWNG